MNRLITLLLISILAVDVMAADNPFKRAKAAIKTKQNLENVEKDLVKHATNREVAPTERARAFNMAAQVTERINEVENEKLYLKQKFDTVRFFNALLRLYSHVERCDSIEREPDENGRVRPQFAKANARLRSRYRSNLLQGGKWMMARQRWGEAYNFFNTYCHADSVALQADTMRLRIAYWASTCAYASGDMSSMLQYVDDALELHQDEAHLLECKARAQIALGDTASWEKTLEQGMTHHPGNLYFFVQHNQYLRTKKYYDEALAWSERLSKQLPDSAVFLYGSALVYYEKDDLDKCIETCERLVRINAEYIEPHLYLGASWVRKATLFAEQASYDMNDVQGRADRKRAQEMYRSALGPLEMYRHARPDDSKTWKPLLFQVYYALNMGHELEELERIVE